MKKKLFLKIFAAMFVCTLAVFAVGMWQVYKLNKSTESNVLIAEAEMIGAFAVALAFAAFASKRISEYLTSKMNDVGQILRKLNDGRYIPVNTDRGDTELQSVLNQINDLNEKTHSYIQSEIAEKQKLSMVLDNVTEGIAALDRDKKIIFANRAVYRIFESVEDCVGQCAQCIFDKKICDRLDFSESEIYYFDYSKNDREYIVTVRKIVNVVPDSRVCLIIVINDVTKEKQAAKEKSDFFENASHELKTPITVIQGHSELLLSKGVLGESETKQVDRIYKETQRLSVLINDMLKLSKLEKGNDEKTEISVNMESICTEAISELEKMIREKNIECSVEGKMTVVGDPEDMYELVINLCTNAVKYNKDNGSIKISLSEAAGKNILKVSDTGIGIEKEHIPRLCERFYRVDKSRSKKTGGTGLGLAIVKHICVQYGAYLTIESDVGVGTCVTVEFAKNEKTEEIR